MSATDVRVEHLRTAAQALRDHHPVPARGNEMAGWIEEAAAIIEDGYSEKVADMAHRLVRVEEERTRISRNWNDARRRCDELVNRNDALIEERDAYLKALEDISAVLGEDVPGAIDLESPSAEQANKLLRANALRRLADRIRDTNEITSRDMEDILRTFAAALEDEA